MRSDLSHKGRGKTARLSLRCDEQFANLGHAYGARSEQMACDCALRTIFRETERIARL
jgi:hypothetical protein